LIKHSGLSSFDRLLGAAFGLARGAVFIGLGVILIEFLGLGQEAWWEQARLRPYAERAAAAVKYYAEIGTRYLQHQGAV
jgi:membrane protein required for colicin V production